MAQATAKISLVERLHWNDFFKPWIVRLVFVGIGLLIGLYILAPQQNRAGANYLPSSFTSIPTGMVQFTSATGVSTFIPVRIADSFTARRDGFKGVGLVALNNSFLLYAQSRETSSATGYNFDMVSSPLELAVINGEGKVTALEEVPLGTARLSVTENHRWVLAAKTGMLGAYGIAVGSLLDPESIQKMNY